MGKAEKKTKKKRKNRECNSNEREFLSHKIK